MGRTAKKEVKEVVDTEVITTDKDVVVVEKSVPVKGGVSYSISASFKRVTRDGDKINHKYKGVGASLAEAIEGIVGSDEDLVDEYNKPFPKGVNGNVLLKVRTSAGYELERNVATHVAKDILENKNVALAAKVLGVVV